MLARTLVFHPTPLRHTAKCITARSFFRARVRAFVFSLGFFASFEKERRRSRFAGGISERDEIARGGWEYGPLLTRLTLSLVSFSSSHSLAFFRALVEFTDGGTKNRN